MTHEERYNLALKYSEELRRELGNNLVSCCLYGSTSRGTDTKWSDLEMLVVTREDTPSRFFLVDMIPVSIKTITDDKLSDILQNPDKDWPFYAGLMNNLEVLSGDEKLPGSYLEIAMNVPESKFIEAAKKNVSELVFESCGRIFSCTVRKRYDDIFCAVIETLLEMRTMICLINHTFVNWDYFEGIKETFKFEKIPKNYPVLATKLWQSCSPFEIARYARKLLKNYVQFINHELKIDIDF